MVSLFQRALKCGSKPAMQRASKHSLPTWANKSGLGLAGGNGSRLRTISNCRQPARHWAMSLSTSKCVAYKVRRKSGRSQLALTMSWDVLDACPAVSTSQTHQSVANRDVRLGSRLCKNAKRATRRRHSASQNALQGVFSRSGMVKRPLKTRRSRVLHSLDPKRT